MASNKENNSPLAVFAITERGDKTYWSKIGVAFVNRDRSITVQMDSLPVSGKLQIRSEEKSEQR